MGFTHGKMSDVRGKMSEVFRCPIAVEPFNLVFDSLEVEVGIELQQFVTQTEWADRYKEANERLMKRNLWERIINKKTYL